MKIKKTKSRKLHLRHWYAGNSRFPVHRVALCEIPGCKTRIEMNFNVHERGFIEYIRSQGWLVEISRYREITKVYCPQHADESWRLQNAVPKPETKVRTSKGKVIRK